MRRIVLTGFEPFGSFRYNPTISIVRNVKVDKREYEIIRTILPSEFYGSAEQLSYLIDTKTPDIVLSLGLTSKRDKLNFEKRGRNIMHAKKPDNSGFKPRNKKIIKNAQNFYKTNINNDCLVNILNSNDIYSVVSNDANKYVCNTLIYLTMRKIREEKLPIKYGFVHIPIPKSYPIKNPEKISENTLDEMIKGINITLENIKS